MPTSLSWIKELVSRDKIQLARQVNSLTVRNQQLSKDIKKYQHLSGDVLLDKLKQRYSCRSFQQKEVPWEIIHDIITFSQTAPKAGDIDNTELIVISSKDVKYEIARQCMQQLWLLDAPYLIAVLRTDLPLFEYFGERDGASFSIQNTAAVIEHILLGAQAHDLGACWIGSFHTKPIRETLNIPQDYTLDAIIPLGYHAEIKEKKTPKEKNIHFETYGKTVK